MNQPSIIYAGDKVEWTESLSDYPASEGWTLKYTLINSSYKESFSSAADGDDHDITLLNADTADWNAGTYILQPYVEHTDGTIQTLERTTLEVKQNLLTATTYDFRTHARKTLEAIEAAIERRATIEQISMQITTRGGSSKALQYMNMDELIKAREYYQDLVNTETAKENIEAGKPAGNKILLQFN